MRRVAEIIYIVPEEREEFLRTHITPTKEQEQIMWLNGMRNQYYFQLQDVILMTFEYVGRDFYADMKKLSIIPEMDGFFVPLRRKNVAADRLKTTNWWAPLKICGKTLINSPMENEEEAISLSEQYHSMVNGYMEESPDSYDINYSEDDWSESIHI